MEGHQGSLFGTPERQVAIVALVVLVLIGLGGGMMMGPGMMLGGPLLLIGGGLLLVRLLRGDRLPDMISAWNGGGVDRASDILRERYARGELSDEQYEQMRQVLGESATADH